MVNPPGGGEAGITVESELTLLERERELSVLEDRLGEARSRRGHAVLVEAPAGLGKTSLLRAAGESAREAGFLCLTARATELERDFAYGCVRQLLEPVVARASEAEREAVFEGAAAFARPLFSPAGGPADAGSVDSAFGMLHGLYWLTANLAEQQPLALLVDDLQWADPETLRYLNYLAPRLDGLPLALVAAARPEETVAGELPRLASAPETTILRPRPLSLEATASLCEAVLGQAVAPEFVAACRDATGGNPFFVEALVREVSQRELVPDAEASARVRGIGPAEVARAVLLRLTDSPEARDLVRALAVMGDGASLGETAELAELGEPDAAAAADALAAMSIVKRSEPLEFAHPVVREAVYADIGPRARRRQHARAATILAGRGASEERVAAQIVESEPAGDPVRVELLRRVAAAALARGAPAAASAWLRRALAEPPRPEDMADVLLALGSAEVRLGSTDAADHLTEAVELADEPALLGPAARQLALALSVSGRTDQSVDVLESAIAVVEPVDRELSLLLQAEVASHAQQASPEIRGPAARRLARHEDLPGETPGERLVAASLACERAKLSRSAADAAAHLLPALADGRLVEEQQGDLIGPFYDLVIGLLATDELAPALAAVERALVHARARASVPGVAYLTTRRGRIFLRQGDVRQAEAEAWIAGELLSTHRIPLGTPFAMALLLEALIERDDLEGAERALVEPGLCLDMRPGPSNNFLTESIGRLHLASGRTEEGVEALMEFGRRDELWGGASPLASRWRSRAALGLAVLGEQDDARRMAAEDLERARQWGTATGVGIALRAVALVKGGPASIDRLEEAAEVLDRSPSRLEQARALADLGAALRRANRRAEARGVLRNALDRAERCGARALANRTRTELRAAGGPTSDPEGTGVEQLTVSERRVAELAADGHSNPEIAQTLFVTRKTVETHLGRVYRKLDISGRGELTAVLAEPKIRETDQGAP